MKKLLLMATLGVSALLASPAKAQVSVNINIGAQPAWGPTGYSHVDYYYLPEIESYYYVPTRKFIYYRENRWVHSNYLPSRYNNYDLRRGRKVVINSYRPYLQHNNYRNQYSYARYAPNRGYYNENRGFRGPGRDDRRFEPRGNQGWNEGRGHGGNEGRGHGGNEGRGHGGDQGGGRGGNQGGGHGGHGRH
jgi:hypothetical protein